MPAALSARPSPPRRDRCQVHPGRRSPAWAGRRGEGGRGNHSETPSPAGGPERAAAPSRRRPLLRPPEESFLSRRRRRLQPNFSSEWRRRLRPLSPLGSGAGQSVCLSVTRPPAPGPAARCEPWARRRRVPVPRSLPESRLASCLRLAPLRVRPLPFPHWAVIAFAPPRLPARASSLAAAQAGPARSSSRPSVPPPTPPQQPQILGLGRDAAEARSRLGPTAAAAASPRPSPPPPGASSAERREAAAAPDPGDGPAAGWGGEGLAKGDDDDDGGGKSRKGPRVPGGESRLLFLRRPPAHPRGARGSGTGSGAAPSQPLRRGKGWGRAARSPPRSRSRAPDGAQVARGCGAVTRPLRGGGRGAALPLGPAAAAPALTAAAAAERCPGPPPPPAGKQAEVPRLARGPRHPNPPPRRPVVFAGATDRRPRRLRPLPRAGRRRARGSGVGRAAAALPPPGALGSRGRSAARGEAAGGVRLRRRWCCGAGPGGGGPEPGAARRGGRAGGAPGGRAGGRQRPAPRWLRRSAAGGSRLPRSGTKERRGGETKRAGFTERRTEGSSAIGDRRRQQAGGGQGETVRGTGGRCLRKGSAAVEPGSGVGCCRVAPCRARGAKAAVGAR